MTDDESIDRAGTALQRLPADGRLGIVLGFLIGMAVRRGMTRDELVDVVRRWWMMFLGEA